MVVVRFLALAVLFLGAGISARGEFSPDAQAVWDRFVEGLESVRSFKYDATLKYESSNGRVISSEIQTRLEDRLSGNSVVRFRNESEADTSVYVENQGEYILRIRDTMHATIGSGKFDFSVSAVRPFAVWTAMLNGALGIGEARFDATMELDACLRYFA